MKKLFLRDFRDCWYVGYYDKCSCGYACDRHFRAVESFPKSEIAGAFPYWLVSMVAAENPAKYKA